MEEVETAILNKSFKMLSYEEKGRERVAEGRNRVKARLWVF